MTTTEHPEPQLTPQRIRQLTAEDLNVAVHEPPAEVEAGAEPTLNLDLLDEADPILERVRDLLSSYGGIIFVGPPGTGKSWYAARVGYTLVGGNESRLRLLQFHPSYQYEDFVEGFVPRDDGKGFVLRDKHFQEMCKRATDLPEDELVVLVIDELSRGDPGRVFGEALTYIEKSRRALQFQLASGATCVVPSNLVILATMNPLDRGVDEVDAAFERRFAKVAMEPDSNQLARFLIEASMSEDLRERVHAFFQAANGRARSNPYASLGHTYFEGVQDEDGLRRLWEHQLRFHFDKAYRHDADGRDVIYRLWDRVLVAAPSEGAPSDNGGESLVEEEG